MKWLLPAVAIMCRLFVMMVVSLRRSRRNSIGDDVQPRRNAVFGRSEVPPRPVPTAPPAAIVAAPRTQPVYSAEEDARYQALWDSLSGAGMDTLVCLCKHGPTWDGDVPSKAGRNELLEKGLAAKIVLKNSEQGYQAATYLGSYVYRVAFVEPRKEIVRAAVGADNAAFVRPR